MQLSKTIGFRISLGFGLLILAIVVNTLLSKHILDQFHKSQEDINNILNPSILTLTELHTSIHRTIDLLLLADPVRGTGQAGPASEAAEMIRTTLPGLHGEIEQLSEGWLRSERRAYQDLNNYLQDSIYARVTGYLDNAFPDVEADTSPATTGIIEIQRICRESDNRISLLIQSFENRAARGIREANAEYERGKNILLFSDIGITIATLIIAAVLLYSLISQIRHYRNIISSMAKGVLPEAKLREGNDEMGQIGAALNNLIRGLKDLSDFSEEIGKGNFKSEFKPLSEGDVLGNSLIRLREDLKNAAVEDIKRKREDERRNWANQGLARFSDILREHSGDLEELAENMIAGLVKYLEAKVGGIFLINEAAEGEEVIELVASYAYDRKKHLQKKIMKGEGLVGRCVQEGSTIFLTDIPKGYISIKSGLGQDDPRSLIIVPMKINEKVIGVIEIASLEVFESFQIEFIERIGTSMASSIATFRSAGG